MRYYPGTDAFAGEGHYSPLDLDLEDWLLEAPRLGAVGTLSSEHEYVTHRTKAACASLYFSRWFPLV